MTRINNINTRMNTHANTNTNSNTNNYKAAKARVLIAATILAGASLKTPSCSTAFTSTSFNIASRGKAVIDHHHHQHHHHRHAFTNSRSTTLRNPLFMKNAINADANLDIDIDNIDIHPSLTVLPSFESNATTTTALSSFTASLASSLSSSSSDNNDNNNGMRALPDHEQNSEFELMLGKAMDTLKTDYPDLLIKQPFYGIYDPNIEVVDPSGVTLHSIQSYKTSFQLIHTIVKIFYCPKKSRLTFRLAYDCARKNIRVSWNAVLVPRFDLDGGGRRSQLHVDGISVYELDRVTGLINQHRVERLLVNDTPVKAPQGIFSLIREEARSGPEGNGVPVYYKSSSSSTTAGVGSGGGSGSGSSTGASTGAGLGTHMLDNNLFDQMDYRVMKYQKSKDSTSMLFSISSSSDMDKSSEQGAAGGGGEQFEHELFNQEAFEKKNASRKRFGLPPITELDYVSIEEKTRELTKVQQQKADAAATVRAATAAELLKKEKRFGGVGSFLSRMNKSMSTCESNFDCERPEVCCDFVFRKTCCSSGTMVFNGEQRLEKMPQRVVADDDQWARKKGGPDQDWGY